MPSIFPGMDPFIEGYEWEDFHNRFITMHEPVERTLPGPVDIEETYLVIRHLESSEVITVIELLFAIE